MRQLNDSKKRYNEIPIPKELSARVQEAIERSEKKRADERRAAVLSRKNGLKKGMMAAAAAVVVFTTALNTSTAFAKSVSAIPVIGEIARVLTFRSYEQEEDDIKLSVEIPSVEMIADSTGQAPDSVNRQIYQLCEQYAGEAKKRAIEYRQAFLDTGGTQEEWAAHKLEIRVWYEIKSQTENYLSLMVSGSESWSSAYGETRYYNIDLKSGNLVTLKDLLGDDYADIVNTSIREQMKQRTDVTFWTPEQGGFTGISDHVRFYINAADHPVIVFEKYEIAPGSEGQPEFEIQG